MATARWFFEIEPDSKFVIQEHLRQDYWRNGPSTMWIDVVESKPPYRAVGYWHDVTLELEWMPREYVQLRTNKEAPELIRVTTLQLGFKPIRREQEGDRFIVEWRPRGAVEAPAPSVGATPAIEMPSE